MSIRVLLVDDHAMVRSGLALLIRSQVDMEGVGEAEEAAERARSDAAAEVDFSVVAAQIAEARAQQRTIEELRKYKR